MTALSAAEVSALHDALDDEYQSWASYDQVIQDFGEINPFMNIRAAEARHIEALSVLFRTYAIDLPENTWIGRAPRHDSIRAACEAAVAAEIANAGLYQRLMAATRRSDILMVFERLRDASQQRHLPAFRRCLERSGGRGGAPH
ncbi:hypothetical protein [Castellaniella sp.]|uniref:hypothetical protein n=1 Tax=Castellaniella sp. TaxID=1955812 RepID=UPI00356042F1